MIPKPRHLEPEYGAQFKDRSRERMGEEMATAFDEEVREVIAPSAKEGMLEFQVTGHIVWGIPQEFTGK